MQITININDSSKAEAFLNFIKSLDYISVKENVENKNHLTMSEQEIIDRVALTNEQIKKGETISHVDLQKEVKDW